MERMNTNDYFAILHAYATDHDEERLATSIEKAGGFDLLIATFVNDINRYRPTGDMFFTIRLFEAPAPVGVITVSGKGCGKHDLFNGLRKMFLDNFDLNVIALSLLDDEWEQATRFDEVWGRVHYYQDGDKQSNQIQIQRVHSYAGSDE